MSTATAIENGLPRRRAVAFIILLGMISLFADMTYEGARSITGPYLGVLGVTATTIGVVSGFGELVGPIWRNGDARFGFLVEGKHLNFADIVHGGNARHARRSGHGHDRTARLWQQAACHHRTEYAVHRRGAA